MPLQPPNREAFIRKSTELVDFAHFMGMRWNMGFFGTDAFTYEQKMFVHSLEQDITSNFISYQNGIDKINRRIEDLQQQSDILLSKETEMYAVIRRERRKGRIALVLAEVGFVSGLTQMVGGGVLCVKSRGAACAKYGVPNIIQGANNIYENGYYIIFMKNTTGTVRDAYHYVANKLGVSNDAADQIYGLVDIALTTGNYTKLTLLAREKSWRLFRHVRTDFIRGWQEAGKLAMGVDVLGSIANLYQMYKIETKSTIKPVEEQGKNNELAGY
jgi:hypothetical protein